MIQFALFALLAASAGAEQTAFVMNVPGPNDSYSTSGVSADGYHYAEFVTLKGKSVMLKDGRVLEEDVQQGEVGVKLSADGAVVAYVVKARSSDGAGEQVHVNGKPIGSIYRYISDFKLSPKGTQLAYAAQDAQGWRVVSTLGQSPVVPEKPGFIAISDEGLVYILNWEGKTFLYRGTKPVAVRPYESVTASSDLSRVAGIYRDENKRCFIEENGAQVGASWSAAKDVQYLDGGKHLAFFVESGPVGGMNLDAVVVDGVSYPIQPTPLDRGVHFVAVAPGKSVPIALSGEPPVLMTAGKKRATMKTAAGYADAWIGFSPSGAHWLTYADGKLLSESGIVQAHAPYPMGAVVFDGENEYHYMGEDGLEVQLVCGALGGSAHGTRCAKKARARGLHSSDD